MPEPSFHYYISYFLILNTPSFFPSPSHIPLSLVKAWIILTPTFSHILLPSPSGHNKLCQIPPILCHLLPGQLMTWLSAYLGSGIRSEVSRETPFIPMVWAITFTWENTWLSLSISPHSHWYFLESALWDMNSVLISTNKDNPTKNKNNKQNVVP